MLYKIFVKILIDYCVYLTHYNFSKFSSINLKKLVTLPFNTSNYFESTIKVKELSDFYPIKHGVLS